MDTVSSQKWNWCREVPKTTLRLGNSQEASQDLACGGTYSCDLLHHKNSKQNQQREKEHGVKSGEPGTSFQGSFSSEDT